MDTQRISDTELDQLDLSLMPPLAREIIKTVGISDGFKLLEFRGGRRLFVPETADENCQLAGVISMDGLRKLCARYGGSRLSLTKMDKVLMQLKHKLLREMRAQKKTVPAIAEAFDYSERRVYQLSSTPDTDKNLDLFNN